MEARQLFSNLHHYIKDYQDSENYGKRVNNENAGNYKNKEEERNITMVENPIASRLGESVRTSDIIKGYINVKSVDYHITNSNKQ